MAELWRQTKVGLNIVSEAEVLSFSYTGDEPREVIARVNLGDSVGPIVGSGNYTCRFYINNTLVSPDATTNVNIDIHQTILTSRALPIEEGDVVSIRVVGLAGDTAVDTVTSLRDATPITVGDVQGVGGIIVDHNYGGLDALTVETSVGAAMEGVNIWAYRQADYNANKRSREFVIGTAITDVAGHWVQPMMLDGGVYVLLFFKQGAINPLTMTLTVS